MTRNRLASFPERVGLPLQNFEEETVSFIIKDGTLVSVRSQELCRRSGVWKAQPRAPLSSKGNEATVGSQYVKES